MSDSTPATAAIKRAARLFLAWLVVILAAFATVQIVWPDAALPMFVGYCLSWLSSVVLLNFQEARRGR